jgi:hypothetical protein
MLVLLLLVLMLQLVVLLVLQLLVLVLLVLLLVLVLLQLLWLLHMQLGCTGNVNALVGGRNLARFCLIHLRCLQFSCLGGSVLLDDVSTLLCKDCDPHLFHLGSQGWCKRRMGGVGR